MVLLKHFIFIVILALSHIVIASPVQQCQKRNPVQDQQFQRWNNHWRGDGKPIARIHSIPSDELLGYNGVPVLPARPLQPRYLVDGIDDRKKVVSNEYPFNIIRKIYLRPNICTGTAVGPRHFMTARHCIPRKPVPMKLKSKHGQYPRTYETASYVTDIVVVQPRAMACTTSEDFAILIFDQPIFETDGYFGAKQYDYKDNFNPIFCGQGFELGTDTDVDTGQSGGPLYKMENGYAMQVGVLCCYQEQVGGLYASGMHVVSSIAYARGNFP
ncbi:hypothetical protein FVEN_g4338 [Fusarium venenatum]|nr:hypothetical protein FVEN_g4338 [Fusarium venenatum]